MGKTDEGGEQSYESKRAEQREEDNDDSQSGDASDRPTVTRTNSARPGIATEDGGISPTATD